MVKKKSGQKKTLDGNAKWDDVLIERQNFQWLYALMCHRRKKVTKN